MALDAAVANNGHPTARKRLRAVAEFQTYIKNNQGFIPNNGERYQHGERISTGFVESTVNQVISPRFCTPQQLDPTWGPAVAVDPNPRVHWRVGGHVPSVVPREQTKR